MDFKKQVRKPKAQPTDESVIEGTTHDSIQAYVQASKARSHLPRHPPTVRQRLRRFFGR